MQSLPEGDKVKGKKIFEKHCAGCHSIENVIYFLTIRVISSAGLVLLFLELLGDKLEKEQSLITHKP